MSSTSVGITFSQLWVIGRGNFDTQTRYNDCLNENTLTGYGWSYFYIESLQFVEKQVVGLTKWISSKDTKYYSTPMYKLMVNVRTTEDRKTWTNVVQWNDTVSENPGNYFLQTSTVNSDELLVSLGSGFHIRFWMFLPSLAAADIEDYVLTKRDGDVICSSPYTHKWYVDGSADLVRSVTGTGVICVCLRLYDIQVAPAQHAGFLVLRFKKQVNWWTQSLRVFFGTTKEVENRALAESENTSSDATSADYWLFNRAAYWP